MIHGVAALGILLAAFAAPAHAQAPDSARADSARRIRPVTVSEPRAAATVGGASAVVVKTDAIRSSPAPLLEDALRESPFVHMRQNSRGEMELSIRGSDSRQAAVLVDGVPLSIGWDHRVDPSLVPITGAQDLVIVRGLGSVLNGPNTLGGTIEVSHDDMFGRLGTGRMWGGAGVDETAAWVATLGAGREFRAVGGGSLSLRGGVAHRQRDGFALPDGAPDPTAVDGLRTNSDLRETDAFVTTRWRAASGRSLGVMLSAFDAERGVPPEEHLASPRLWRYPEHARAVVALSGSAGTFGTPLGFATLDVGVGLNVGRLRIETFPDRSYATPSAAELGAERTVTGRVAFSHTLPRAARLRATATVANVDYAETLPADTAVDYRQRLLSAGAEVDVPVTSRTAIATGLVFDRAATPLTGGRPAQPPFHAAGWRAGITHDPASGVRLHASTSRRSRFPALRELYSGALNRFLPNPDLRPETLLGFETGFTMDRSLGPIPDATLQVSAFHHDLRDAVARITLPAPDRRFLRVNRDRIRSTGLELLGGLALGTDQRRSLSITADATLQDIRIEDQTAAAAGLRHAENNPEARGMLEVAFPAPAGLRAFGNARYTGRQFCLHADTGGEMALPSTTEL
ncbi:MAG TPA: TonB-dependent receptor, partial [Gemmatimonadaceae bacterium]|nr:TonB-dependent receptor [Gemmatimonadaceae bacterium]